MSEEVGEGAAREEGLDGSGEAAANLPAPVDAPWLVPAAALPAALTVGAHRVTLFSSGPETFSAMLWAILGARASLCLEVYLWREDPVGRLFAAAMADAARRGVEVNVVVDSWGTSLSRQTRAELEGAGVRLVAYNPPRLEGRLAALVSRLRQRNHRKVLIVDNRVAFVGGHNLTDDHVPTPRGPGWRDDHVRVEGPVVQELLYYFLRTWRRCRGAPLRLPLYQHAGRRPDPRVRVVVNESRRRRKAITRLYRDLLRRAEVSVSLRAAYFLPPPKMLRLLRRKARQGVRIRLLLPARSDVPALRLASRTLYGRLLRAGVEIYEWLPSVLHAKTLVVDRRMSTIGSANLDPQSLHHSLEANLFIDDAGVAERLEEQFDRDLEHCRRMTEDLWAARGWAERILGRLFYGLRAWL